MRGSTGILYNRVHDERNRRKKRASILGALSCAEPGWDFLIDLYLCGCVGRRVSVTDLAFGAEVPVTTTLRWLALLEEQDLLTRHPDPKDKRRIHISLTDKGAEVVESVFKSAPTENADGTLTVKIPEIAVYSGYYLCAQHSYQTK